LVILTISFSLFFLFFWQQREGERKIDATDKPIFSLLIDRQRLKKCFNGSDSSSSNKN